MNTAQLSQTLLASWRQRDRDAPWGRWLIAALVVLPSLACLVWLQGPLRWGVPTAIVMLTLHIGWMVVCANLQMQNEPAAARFVPGHVPALQLAAGVGWVVCTLAGTALLGLALPPMVSWQALLLGNAAVALFSLWSSRFWWLWLALCLYAPLIGVFRAWLQAPLEAAYGLWVQHTDSLLALGLIGMAALVPLAFGHGDARHRRAYERQRRLQEIQRMFQEGRQATPAQAFTSLERFSRPFEAAIDAWRQRVVTQADNLRPRSVMARLELVLNGNQHWTYQALTALTVALSLGASLVLVVAFSAASAAEVLQHGAFGMAIGLASMASTPTLARPVLWQTRREQALLRLLPGVPQGAAQNRMVAFIGLRHGLGATAIAAGLIGLLAAVTDQWGLMWLPAIAVPCTLWTVTQAPARMRPPGAMTTVLPVGAYYLLAGLGYVATQRFGVPMLPLMAALLSVGLAAGWVRWRRLSGQPPALPAGRIG